MATSQLVQQLHDRATRGEALSEEERSLLDVWYAEQDQAESTLLGRAPAAKVTADLRAQVDAAVEEMMVVTQRIHVLLKENEVVRQEIRRLQIQLIEKSKAQPA